MCTRSPGSWPINTAKRSVRGRRIWGSCSVAAIALRRFPRSDLSSSLQVQTPIVEQIWRIVAGSETGKLVDQSGTKVIAREALEVAMKNHVSYKFTELRLAA